MPVSREWIADFDQLLPGKPNVLQFPLDTNTGNLRQIDTGLPIAFLKLLLAIRSIY